MPKSFHDNEVVALSQACRVFEVGTESVVALDSVDLTVSEGEVVCLFGASGSGKTTLLNVVAGIETVDSGDVVVAGQSLHRMSENQRADFRLRHVGVVFQSNNLLDEFTAHENVTLPLLARNFGRERAAQSAQKALDTLGVAELAQRFPTSMSGGQRQRVGIARALAGDQSVLAADEPTGALDSQNSQALFALLRRLADERGNAVLLATHDPLAAEVADSIYDIVDGVVRRR